MNKALRILSLIIAPAVCIISSTAAYGQNSSTIPVPAGYGHYCSLTYPSQGWAFSWAKASKDICAAMLKKFPGGTIARAGLFSLTGPNNVVYRCNTGVGLLKGDGTDILDKAVKDSKDKKSCVFTVAPKSLPIFTIPFPLISDIKLNSGFDFARGYTVKSNLGPESNKVNYKGDLVSYVEDHDGFDFGMPVLTPLVTVAEGVVLAARARDVRNHNCPTSPQLEVYVLHTVGTGKYREEFVTYYAHLDRIAPGIVPGKVVTRNQLLGFSGMTGCAEGPHLHFGVSRFTNTATQYRRNHAVPAKEDYDKNTVIDPWGFSWNAAAGFDPWAWRRIDDGVGALSIDLWVLPVLAPLRD